MATVVVSATMHVPVRSELFYFIFITGSFQSHHTKQKVSYICIHRRTRARPCTQQARSHTHTHTACTHLTYTLLSTSSALFMIEVVTLITRTCVDLNEIFIKTRISRMFGFHGGNFIACITCDRNDVAA